MFRHYIFVYDSCYIQVSVLFIHIELVAVQLGVWCGEEMEADEGDIWFRHL